MGKELLLRSFLFLPANNKKFIEKAIMSEADAIILDVEDSVPTNKDDARNMIIQCHDAGYFRNKMTFVRVNNLGTKDFVDDIMKLCLKDIDGFMPSKINSSEDIMFIDRLLSFMELNVGLHENKFMLAPLIETTKAMGDVTNIARASRRLVALCLGGEDYLNDLGSVYTYQESALICPRAILVNAARSRGLLPIDTPFLNIGDMDAFSDRCKVAYKNGFAGNLLINPKQIYTANSAYSPDEHMYDLSLRVIEACRKAGENDKSIAMLEGQMIGPPMKKRAEEVIRQSKLIKEMYRSK